MGVVEGWRADVWVTATPSIHITNEVCTYTAGPGTGCTYQTSVHRFWDKWSAFTIETSTDGTTWVAAPQYKQYFQWVSGSFALPTDLAGLHMRVSGNYFSASQVPECHNWELTVVANTQDTTIFRSQWKRYSATTKNATGKIATFIVDDALASDIGNEMIFMLYTDADVGSGWAFYGHLLQADPKLDVSAVITQDVTFVSDGQVVFYASTTPQ